MRWAALAALIALEADAKTVTYVIAIGNNAPPADAALPPLHFADDDAVRYYAFFGHVARQRWLLSVPDAETRQRYAELVGAARAPTLRELRAVIREASPLMRADAERGDVPVLVLTFSGHGAQADDGEAFLAMGDGPLTRDVLYREVLGVVPATYVHLIIDACHAEAVVGSRGPFAKEADARMVALTDAERAAVLGAASLQRFPGVGALMATAADQESHEWGVLQSGIFTHEVLSGLAGAADVNGDGIVEYSELQAFVASANRDVKDPRAQPRIVAVPPALNPRAPLIELARLDDVAFLDDDLSGLGHFYIELDDGERYLDAHLSAEARARLVLPAQRKAYLISDDREAELDARRGETTRLSALTFVPREHGGRGSIDSTFRTALFRSPFGPTYYEGFADSAGVARVPFVASRPTVGDWNARKPAAVATLGVGAAALVASIVSGSLALAAYEDFQHTELQRPAAEAAQRAGTFGWAGLGLVAGAVVLALVAALIWR